MTLSLNPRLGTSLDAELHSCVTELESSDAVNSFLSNNKFPMKLLPSPVIPTSKTLLVCNAMMSSGLSACVRGKTI